MFARPEERVIRFCSGPHERLFRSDPQTPIASGMALIANRPSATSWRAIDATRELDADEYSEAQLSAVTRAQAL